MLGALARGDGLGVLEPIARDAGGRIILLEILADPAVDPQSRASACYALANYQHLKRPAAAMAVIAADPREDADLRIACVEGLLQLDPDRGVDAALPIARDRLCHPALRIAAVTAAGWVAPGRSAPEILKVLADPSDRSDVRAACADALGATSEPDAARLLFETVVEEDVVVRFSSLGALGELGRREIADPESVADLARAIAARDDRVRAGWWSVRKQALDAAEKALSPEGSARPSMLRAADGDSLSLAVATFGEHAARTARLPRERATELAQESRFEPGAGDEPTDVVVHFPWLDASFRQPWDGTADDLVGAAAVIGDKVGRAMAARGLLGLRTWRDPEG